MCYLEIRPQVIGRFLKQPRLGNFGGVVVHTFDWSVSKQILDFSECTLDLCWLCEIRRDGVNLDMRGIRIHKEGIVVQSSCIPRQQDDFLEATACEPRGDMHADTRSRTEDHEGTVAAGAHCC